MRNRLNTLNIVSVLISVPSVIHDGRQIKTNFVKF